jgi:hypothetical protein
MFQTISIAYQMLCLDNGVPACVLPIATLVQIVLESILQTLAGKRKYLLNMEK